jgi:hypothetical protein
VGPAIVQVVDGLGQVQVTRYLWAEEPLPAYAVRAAAPDRVETAPQPEPVSQPDRRHPWGWLAVGGLAAGASAVAYVAAADSAATFAGPLPEEYDREALLALRSRTNLLVTGSVAAGGLAAVGITTFVVRW